MATYKFTRHPGKEKKGQEVVLNKYLFEDGVLITDENLGPAFEPILCGYYGCELEIIPDPVEAPISNVDPSLKAAETKPGAPAAAAANAPAAANADAKPADTDKK